LLRAAFDDLIYLITYHIFTLSGKKKVLKMAYLYCIISFLCLIFFILFRLRAYAKVLLSLKRSEHENFICLS